LINIPRIIYDGTDICYISSTPDGFLNMFKVNEILLVVNDILAEEAGLNQPYLSKGTKLRVVNIMKHDGEFEFHALLLGDKKQRNLPNGVFMIIKEDIDKGDVVSLSEMRDKKLNQLGL